MAVCGGDGTVNWLLSCIGALPFDPLPAVGILPLGTGNDTARAFGWGHKYPGRKGIVRNLRRMRTAPVVTFDRWHATVDHYDVLTEEQVKGLPAAMREMKEEPSFLGYRPPNKQRDDPEYAAVVGAAHVEVEEHKQPQQQPVNGDGVADTVLPPSARDHARRSSASTVVSIPLPSSPVANGSSSSSSSYGPALQRRHVRRELQFNNYVRRTLQLITRTFACPCTSLTRRAVSPVPCAAVVRH